MNIDVPKGDWPNVPPISIFSKKRHATPSHTTTPIPTYSKNISDSTDIITPELLKSSLEGLKNKFHVLLDEYNKYYNLVHIGHQNNQTNTSLLNQSRQNLESYFNSLDGYFNEIQTNMNKINSKGYVLNENIQKNKINTEIANDNVVNVSNNYIGSSEMTDDYVKKYNNVYLSTFTLSIITVLLGGTLVKIYGRIL
jgi:hypothetical protein